MFNPKRTFKKKSLASSLLAEIDCSCAMVFFLHIPLNLRKKNPKRPEELIPRMDLRAFLAQEMDAQKALKDDELE